MNRGELQLQSATPVQQLMATSAGGGGGGGGGGPNWSWSVNGVRPQPPPLPPPPFFHPAPANYLSPHAPLLPFPAWHDTSSSANNNITNNNGAQDELSVDHQSLSQLLLGGLMVGDEEGKCSGTNQVFQGKRLGLNWSDPHAHQGLMMELQASCRNDGAASSAFHMNMKRESCGSYDLYSGRRDHHHHHHNQNHDDRFDQTAKHTWLSQMVVDNNNSNNNNNNNNNVSSASNNNCATPTTNMLDFSSKHDPSHLPPDRSSAECNTTGGGGTLKRARVQSTCSTQQSPFKVQVRKEKLGDRITALHQLVSPFGKTDTASVLLEAIGYIKFLQGQIEALSLPYLGGAATARRHQHSESENVERKKGLRSRGLCLVPVSCTLQVGSDNGADYWAPAAHGGPFNL